MTGPVLGGEKAGMSLASCLWMFLSDLGSFVGGKTEKESPEM